MVFGTYKKSHFGRLDRILGGWFGLKEAGLGTKSTSFCRSLEASCLGPTKKYWRGEGVGGVGKGGGGEIRTYIHLYMLASSTRKMIFAPPNPKPSQHCPGLLQCGPRRLAGRGRDDKEGGPEREPRMRVRTFWEACDQFTTLESMYPGVAPCRGSSASKRRIIILEGPCTRGQCT